MLGQKDDKWESWRLNDLTDNLKICGQNFLITSTGDKPSSSGQRSKDYSRGKFMEKENY